MATTRRTTRPARTRRAGKSALSSELQTVALFGAGIVAGSLGGNLLDKTLRVDASDTRLSLKKAIRPLALAGLGTAASLRTGSEQLRSFCRGVAASGVLAGAKLILPQSVLSGLNGQGSLGGMDAFGEPTGVGELSSAGVYYEAEAAPYLPESVEGYSETYEPELPRLEATPLGEAIPAYYLPESEGSTLEAVEVEIL